MTKLLPLGFAILLTFSGCGKSEAQKKKDAEAEAAKAFAEAFAKLGQAAERSKKAEDEKLAKRTVRLGSTIKLGSLEIRPLSVELRKINIKPFFGRELQQKGPFLVLKVQVKNVSEGQVFSPFMTAEVKDSFENQLDDAVGFTEVGLIEGNEITKEIGPGETATVLVCKSIKITKATSYQWDLSTHVDNKDTTEQWRCVVKVSEVATIDPQN